MKRSKHKTTTDRNLHKNLKGRKKGSCTMSLYCQSIEKSKKRSRATHRERNRYYLDLSYGYSNGHRPKYLSTITSGQCNNMEVIIPEKIGSNTVYCPPPALTYQELEKEAKRKEDLEEMKKVIGLDDYEYNEFEAALMNGLEKTIVEKMNDENISLRRSINRTTDKSISHYDMVKSYSDSACFGRIENNVLQNFTVTGNGEFCKDKLRSELNSSIANVDKLSECIKKNIASIQWQYRKLINNQPLNDHHIQARKHLRFWAVDRIFSYVTLCACQMKMSAFRRWSYYIKLIRRLKKWYKFLIYQGFMKLFYACQLYNHRSITIRWQYWHQYVTECQKHDRKTLEEKSILDLQCWFRMKLMQRYVMILKKQRKNRIVTRVQSRVRTSIAIKIRSKIDEQRCKLRSIIVIQCARRVQMSRMLLKILSQERKRQNAAISIQKIARGLCSRKNVIEAKHQYRLSSCSMLIQRIWRGNTSRKKSQIHRTILKRERASILIQSLSRSCLCRFKVVQMRKCAQELVRKRQESVLILQRTYRKHQRIVTTKLEVEKQVAFTRRRFKAATKVQSLYRQKQAKLLTQRLAKQRLNSMVSSAKRWKEMWDMENSCWYYCDVDSGNTLWEPPSTGYTKSDTRLVLQDGNVIDDLLFGAPELVLDVCVECSTSIASRLCEQCHDKYCTTCYNSVHPQGGRRALHTYVYIGPVECEECVKDFATKWCIRCDDPFCDSCWEKVHNRGNRLIHGHCNIRSDGTVSPRAWKADGTAAGIFMPGDSLQQQNKSEYTRCCSDTEDEAAMNGNMHYESDTLATWTSHYDEYGTIYYFNNETGESSYQTPPGVHSPTTQHLYHGTRH